MKHDPNDPAGEYFRDWNNYCAQEGIVPEKDRPFLNQREKPKTVTQHVHELLLQREIIGQSVYHRPLFHDVRSALEWMEEALAEEADKLQYLMAAYLALEDVINNMPPDVQNGT